MRSIHTVHVQIKEMPDEFAADAFKRAETWSGLSSRRHTPQQPTNFFFLLCQMRRILLSPSSNGEVQPVPDEVRQAVDDELREPWMDDLDRFVGGQLRCVTKAWEASSAADVREAFALRCDSLQKREVGLKLAAQGFKEETKHYTDMGTFERTTKRVYSFIFAGGDTGMAKVK